MNKRVLYVLMGASITFSATAAQRGDHLVADSSKPVVAESTDVKTGTKEEKRAYWQKIFEQQRLEKQRDAEEVAQEIEQKIEAVIQQSRPQSKAEIERSMDLIAPLIQRHPAVNNLEDQDDWEEAMRYRTAAAQRRLEGQLAQQQDR